MPKNSLSPTKEIEEEPEQIWSPSDNEPDTRAATQERQGFKFSEGHEMASEMAAKLKIVRIFQ